VVGLAPRLVRKLRRGDFVRQGHVDLHGMTADEAQPMVERFLVDAVKAGWRCVLIVHGKGLNSKDQTPVLKEKLKSWLARGRAATLVLAFTSARPHDGGAGALYVLLRRDRRRSPIRVTEGTTR
jgi:DNA-nicking Smr family endonuclease